LSGTEGNHPACANRNFFASLGVAPRALAFVAQLKVAEAGQFNLFIIFKSAPNLFKKEFDKLFCFTLV
jgi:hypothetical protein